MASASVRDAGDRQGRGVTAACVGLGLARGSRYGAEARRAAVLLRRASIEARLELRKHRMRRVARSDAAARIRSFLSKRQFLCISKRQCLCVTKRQFLCVTQRQFLCVTKRQFLCVAI